MSEDKTAAMPAHYKRLVDPLVTFFIFLYERVDEVDKPVKDNP
jgi:hypothetical protein